MAVAAILSGDETGDILMLSLVVATECRKKMGRGRSWGEEDEMRSKWEVTTGLCPNFCAAAELVVPSNLLPGILFPLAAGSVAKGEKGTLAGDGPHRDLNTLPGGNLVEGERNQHQAQKKRTAAT